MLSAILGGAGALGSFLGSKKGGSTSTSTAIQPAPRDTDQQKMWDDFMTFLYGSTSGSTSGETPTAQPQSNFTNQDLIGFYNDPNFRGNMNDLQQWAAPAPQATTPSVAGDIPSLLDRITQDTEARTTADQTLIDALTGNLGTWQGAREGALSDYERAVKDSIYGNQINLDIGNGQTMPWSSGSQRDNRARLGALAGNVLDQRASIADTSYGKSDLLSQIINKFATTHVPNEAYNTYFNQIKGIVDQSEDRRYQTPTTSQTSQSNPSLLDRIAGGVNVGGSVYDLIQALGGGNSNGTNIGAYYDPSLIAWGS